MDTAAIFTVDGNQAVRLPKYYRIDADEVLINRIGSTVILVPKDNPWKGMLESLDMFTEDFPAEGVDDLPVQQRLEL